MLEMGGLRSLLGLQGGDRLFHLLGLGFVRHQHGIGGAD
jgi:hypothetical protein